jgi:hypothetical protein
MLYFTPEFIGESGQIINVVNQKGKAVGYLAVLLNAKKDRFYIFGHLTDRGEKENYIDIVSHYATGLKKAYSNETEPYISLYIGEDTIELEHTDSEEEAD